MIMITMRIMMKITIVSDDDGGRHVHTILFTLLKRLGNEQNAKTFCLPVRSPRQRAKEKKKGGNNPESRTMLTKPKRILAAEQKRNDVSRR